MSDAPSDRLSHGDFLDPPADPARFRRKLALTVFAVASAALMLELLLARIFPVVLGNNSALLAIPVAMFGLSIGALILHWMPRDPSARIIPILLPLLFLATLGGLLAEFHLFNEVFGITHNRDQNPLTDGTKIFALSTVFVPAFALSGIVLSTAFSAGARQVGKLYAYDLVGSAGACVLTPILLQYYDLGMVVVYQLLILGLAMLYVLSQRRLLLLLLGLPLFAFFFQQAFHQALFDVEADPAVLGAHVGKGREVEELAHHWNDISRVTLLQFTDPKYPEGHPWRLSWTVMHDDGISNVHVEPYSEERLERPYSKQHSTHALAAMLDDPPKTALVIFAGAGRDMVVLEQFVGTGIAVTGVELNPLVPQIVTRSVEDRWRLAEFYARPEMNLVADEGRSFLNRSKQRYDLIFVATNGAQLSGRTGHSRKFLDSAEAMAAYLDHLAPGGSIIFARQDVGHKVEIFKRLLQQRGLAALSEAGMFFGPNTRGPRQLESMIIKPSGFSVAEVDRILPFWQDRRDDWCKYAPGHPVHPEVSAYVQGEVDEGRYVPTDDQPYDRMVDIGSFELRPSEQRFRQLTYIMDWTKVFTLLLFSVLTVLTVLAFAARRRGGKRLPVGLIAYFLGTGFCYMVAQIGLMAKVGLLMGRPLLSIAVVLAAFLVFNGAGAAWIGRGQERGTAPPIWKLALAAALALLVSMGMVELLAIHALALPSAGKALLLMIALSPLGFVLGTFYPTGVGLAVQRGMAALVPMTFGLATLSSVITSAYAMIAVINLGFRAVILQALPGYLIIAGAAFWWERRR